MQIPAIDQRYVEVQELPGAAEDGYDATWDIYAGADGRVYISCCGEGFKSLTVRLYAYDPNTKTCHCLFDAAQVTHPPPGTIPQSKVHTSMAGMEDGRIIMCTHTTAPAAGHPFWAPVQGYHDLYEGYPGSHIIIYDPATDHAEDLGIPVPRESTYGGGVYIAAARQYFMLGLMRGHLYSFHLDNGQTRDLGYVGLGVRLFKDSGGRVYGISPSGTGGRGRLYRYDPFADKLDDVETPIPGDPAGVLGYAEHGPDGKVYLARLYCDRIMAFDPERETVRDLGMGFPDADRYRVESLMTTPKRAVWGLSFLGDGKLYYTVMAGSLTEVVALMRWDVLGGGTPELLGFVHGAGRTTLAVAEMTRGPDGRLYTANNCGNNLPPRLLVVDAVRLPPAGPSSLMIPRKTVEEPWIRRHLGVAEASGRNSPAVRTDPDRFQRIELYDALLPAWDCVVRGLGVDGNGRLHIGTAGGALVVWNGGNAAVAYRHGRGIRHLAVHGDRGWFCDEDGIWAYEARKISAPPCLIATVPPDSSVSCLRTTDSMVYGLLEPGFRPFVLRDKLRVGEKTGDMIPGRRTIIRGPDDLLYGALDEGFLFACDENDLHIRRLNTRIPAPKGRDFLSRWTAAAISGESIYGGTGDGYLFRFDPMSRRMVNLGKPELSLGVVDLAVVGARVAGIAGRGSQDLCRLFAYLPDAGFESLGNTPRFDLLVSPSGLSCIVSLNDRRIAVGNDERISHVYVCEV